MSVEAARVVGMDPQKRTAWVPWVTIVISLVGSIAGVSLGIGAYMARNETEVSAVKAAHGATKESIAESRAMLMLAIKELKADQQSALKELKSDQASAISEIKQSQTNIESRLLGKVDAIQGSVASQQAQLADIKARQEAANEDKRRLWDELRIESLRRERLEKQLISAGIKPDGGS